MTFKKGQSGNPLGRPSDKTLTITRALQEALSRRSGGPKSKLNSELLVDKLIEMAVVDGNPKAIELILDRVEGKVPTPLQHQGDDLHPLQIEIVRRLAPPDTPKA